MAIIGFSPSQAENVVNAAQTTYNEFMSSMSAGVKDVVNTMEDLWYTKNAVTFFGIFKTEIQKLIDDGENILSSVVRAVDGAGREWSASTNNVYNAHAFASNKATVDVSAIKEAKDGVAGMDTEALSTFKTKMGTIKANLETALRKTAAAIDSNPKAFVGGNQQEELSGSVGTINKNVGTAFDKLIDEAAQAVSQQETSHSDTASQVSTNFQGQ